MKTRLRLIHWSNNPACSARLDKHFDGYHSLQLITHGRMLLSYDDVTHRLGGTQFWFHYPGPRIRLAPEGNTSWHHRHIAFRGEKCAEWLQAGLLARPPLPCPPARRVELVSRFDEILSWAGQNSAAAAAKACAALEILLWDIWEIRSNPDQHRPILDALAGFASGRRFRVGSYQRLAADLGLSTSTLRRRVQEATGMPLHRFIRSLRMEEARRLLRRTDRSLARIADDLGFSDEYHFNREFSRLAGIPPGAYRNSPL